MSLIARYAKVLAPAFLLSATPAVAENLIKNGSFEKPLVRKGGYQTFTTSSGQIPNWTVSTSEGQDIAVVSGAFRQGDFRFPANGGAQWLDLTGAGPQRQFQTMTVSQTVRTKINAKYKLTFAVGNVTGAGFLDRSIVRVLLNGYALLEFSNLTPGPRQSWQTLTATFVAVKNETHLEFLNEDPHGDNHNGLDDVSVELVPTE